jgi:hypothetical protein
MIFFFFYCEEVNINTSETFPKECLAISVSSTSNTLPPLEQPQVFGTKLKKDDSFIQPHLLSKTISNFSAQPHPPTSPFSENPVLSPGCSPIVILPQRSTTHPHLLTALLRGNVLDDCLQSDMFSVAAITSSLQASLSLLDQAQLFEMELVMAKMLQVYLPN